MVAVQATHCDALAVALQFPTHKAVLAAVIGLDRKTAVCPKLALGTEAMGCLQYGHQQGGANRTDRRNLAKQFHCRMFATFPQQLASCCLAHGLQTIQLLVQMLCSNPHPWFHQLGQPLGTMTAAIDACARTGNGPTSVHRLNAIHHPGTVLGEGRITPPQLLKGAYSMFFVVHSLGW